MEHRESGLFTFVNGESSVLLPLTSLRLNKYLVQSPLACKVYLSSRGLRLEFSKKRRNDSLTVALFFLRFDFSNVLTKNHKPETMGSDGKPNIKKNSRKKGPLPFTGTGTPHSTPLFMTSLPFSGSTT